jgi:hypothetical protein
MAADMVCVAFLPIIFLPIPESEWQDLSTPSGKRHVVLGTTPVGKVG